MVEILDVYPNSESFTMNLNNKIYTVRGKCAFTFLFICSSYSSVNDATIHIYHNGSNYAPSKIYNEIQSCGTINLMKILFDNNHLFIPCN